jgi:membrane-bound serine protease (ClpP class)
MMDALLWSLLLLVVGLAFIVLEVFIPSGGVLSVLAAVALIGSLVMAFSGGMVPGVIMLVTMMVVLPLVIAGVIRWWPHTPIGRLIVLETPENDQVLPNTPEYRDLKLLVGRRGTAKTKMLPSGAVVIDGNTYDALADGIAIDPGQPIRVTAVRTNRLIVITDDRIPDRSADLDDPLAQPAEPLGFDSLDGPAT